MIRGLQLTHLSRVSDCVCVHVVMFTCALNMCILLPKGLIIECLVSWLCSEVASISRSHPPCSFTPHRYMSFHPSISSPCRQWITCMDTIPSSSAWKMKLESHLGSFSWTAMRRVKIKHTHTSTHAGIDCKKTRKMWVWAQEQWLSTGKYTNGHIPTSKVLRKKDIRSEWLKVTQTITYASSS